MRRHLALIACAALALAGCASLPTSSPPAPFDVSARDGSGVQFSAEGPSDGSDAATLVSDFLLACAAGPQDDYATARLFLTAASARSWQPETEILVYDTDTAPAVSATSENASRSEVNGVRPGGGEHRPGGRADALERGDSVRAPSLSSARMGSGASTLPRT